MSYNIRHGYGMDEKQDLSRAGKIIASQTPALCAVQEVDNQCSRSDSLNQTQTLAEEIGMKGVFGKFMDYQGGAYGMASFSKLPIRTSNVLKLPDGKYEPRSCIILSIDLSDKHTILFVNVHFDWIQDSIGIANRLKQAKTLINYLNDSKLPCIIAGDFNCASDSPTMNYFKEEGFHFTNKGTDNLSFQGNQKAEIDHILYRNSESIYFKERSTTLLEAAITSDHRPLISELEVTMY